MYMSRNFALGTAKSENLQEHNHKHLVPALQDTLAPGMANLLYGKKLADALGKALSGAFQRLLQQLVIDHYAKCVRSQRCMKWYQSVFIYIYV